MNEMNQAACMTGDKAARLIEQYTQEVCADELCAEPTLSVCLITFNHAGYIREAIDSVICQETNFPLEIVIADDHSQDGTTDIVLDYCHKHADKIRVLLATENLGRYTGNGRLNFVRALQACRGKYIALLDGDDYWTHPQKLQKQVDALDAHPAWSMCFHTASVVCEEGPPYDFTDKLFKEVSTIDDLLLGNYIPTCTTVFRNRLNFQFPDWFFCAPVGDWSLFILNAQQGDIGYLPERMAVYRFHSNGLWASLDRVSRWLATIEFYDAIEDSLEGHHIDVVRQARLQTVKKMYNMIRSQFAEIDTLRNSRSYRLGKAIVWPVSHCWNLLRNLIK